MPSQFLKDPPQLHNELPDGTPLPHAALFADGVVHDWTGEGCPRCRGTGEHQHPFDRSERYPCCGCGGTGDGHGPVWRWEE